MDTQPGSEQSPTEQSRIEESRIEHSPIEQAPTEQSPIEQSPIEQSPIEQSPTPADPSALWDWASPTPYPADAGADAPVGYGPPPGLGYGPPPGAQWGSWGWQAAPPPRPRRRLLAAGAFVAIFAVAAVAGVGARLVVWPSSSSPHTASTQTPSTSGSAAGGASSSSGGGSSTGNGSAGSSLTSSVIAGVVDVNVTLANGAGSAAGTGMVITSSGEVLTNNHVIDGAQSISVQVAGTGPTYSAHVLGYDLTVDVALIKVDGAPSLTTVNLGDSSAVSVGDAVTAVGNALGRSGPPAVTTGSVTALDQQITASDQGGANAETLTGLIQISALIQPGDSGGPLVNSANQVIGMDTAAASNGRFRIRQRGSQVAFAIPINAALTVAHQIEAGGGGNSAVQTGPRAFLGVGTQDDSGAGAQITSVESGSPADNAGMAAGDVITGFGGTTVDSPATLRAAILRHHPGDSVTITWQDGSGNQHTATVSLTSGPPA